MKYGTPGAFRMALTKRLQNRAEATGRSAQRLLQMVAFERFLARIFHTFGERATLKGGVAMELRVERARTTRDIDLRIVGEHPAHLLEDHGHQVRQVWPGQAILSRHVPQIARPVMIAKQTFGDDRQTSLWRS